MTTDQLHSILRAKPFRPFFLKLADGTRVPVRHPELLTLSPSGRTIVVFSGDDEFEVIDLFLVLSLDVKKNGKSGQRKKGGNGSKT